MSCFSDQSVLDKMLTVWYLPEIPRCEVIMHFQVFTFGCNDEGALGRHVEEEEECFTPGKVFYSFPVLLCVCLLQKDSGHIGYVRNIYTRPGRHLVLKKAHYSHSYRSLEKNGELRVGLLRIII